VGERGDEEENDKVREGRGEECMKKRIRCQEKVSENEVGKISYTNKCEICEDKNHKKRKAEI
jgi:hypothetical protein